jgi:aspartyl-tRNA(Asn)/glutamyl-tRNA(Gln) amidotransferase subunit B
MAEYGLSPDDAATLVSSRTLADFFEQAVRLSGNARAVANWMLRDVRRLLNSSGIEIEQSKLRPEHLAALIALIDSGQLSVRSGPQVLEEVFRTGTAPEQVMREQGLAQVSDTAELEAVIDRVLADPRNAKALADYHGGKQTALGYFVGAVMKETRGKANPALVNQLLRQKLGG